MRSGTATTPVSGHWQQRQWRSQGRAPDGSAARTPRIPRSGHLTQRREKEKMADFLSFGEIMLRLKTPGNERFFQSPSFEATFGGGEANVAVSLANFGLDAAFVPALPGNDLEIGRASWRA